MDKQGHCVKCTGKHHTMYQTNKWVHCGEAHPANYHGYGTAKEL